MRVRQMILPALASWVLAWSAGAEETLRARDGRERLPREEIERRLARPGPPGERARVFLVDRPVAIRPYTGGHPRLTIDETCIDPINDHKLQVGVPWDAGGHVVVDVPEAVFSNIGLLFLGHRHIPTIWEERGVELETATWTRQPDASLAFTRRLPNGIAFGVTARSGRGFVDMELWLENGTAETLRGLRTQICVLLGHAKGFNALTSDNKLFFTQEAGWLRYPQVHERPPGKGIYGLGFRPTQARVDAPMAACLHEEGQRWIATVWDHCSSVPNNPICPCIHSDPALPDCPPGQRVSARGKLFFGRGDLGRFYEALIE